MNLIVSLEESTVAHSVQVSVSIRLSEYLKTRYPPNTSSGHQGGMLAKSRVQFLERAE